MQKLSLFIETFVLIILPLGFLQLYPDIYKYRILVMILALGYVGFIAKKLKISPQKMGLRLPTKSELTEVLPAIILAACVVIILKIIFPHLFYLGAVIEESQLFSRDLFLLVYVFISVPLQELIFRGFYLSRLEFVSKNHTFLILYSSVVFALIHIPFHSWPIFIGTFGLGIYLSQLFLKQRNLLILMIIHAILGGMFIFLSLA